MTNVSHVLLAHHKSTATSLEELLLVIRKLQKFEAPSPADQQNLPPEFISSASPDPSQWEKKQRIALGAVYQLHRLILYMITN